MADKVSSKIVFNNDTIKFMSIFSRITDAAVRDCIESNNKLIFIVEENQAGRAIGKKGINVKKLNSLLSKDIKIVEYNSDIIQFIKNLVYPIKVNDIIVEDNVYTMIPLDSQSRSMLIGRNAVNLRENESIIKRYFEIGELKVK